MPETGLLIEVRWEYDGSEVLTAAAQNATDIVVEDVTNFSVTDDVWISDTGPYEIVAVDEDTSTISIDAPGLTEAVEESDPVVPDIGGAPAAIWVAEIVLPDTDTPIEVPMTIKDLAVMPPGIYDPPKPITISDDYETIIDLPGTIPQFDATAYTQPGTEIIAPTDGEPPLSSPAPEVIPGIGAFYLRWVPPANSDLMTFEVHVSDEDGFTADATTLYTETGAYSATLRHLVPIDPATALPYPFEYGVPYYFRTIAKDADGSATQSTQTTATLTQIVGPDVAAHTILGENIVTETLTGDLFSATLVMGSTISTGALDENGDIVGARIDLGPDGLKIFDANGDEVVSFPLTSIETAKVRAHLEVLSAEVLDNFTMHGVNNSISTEGELVLAKGVEPPTSPPTLANEWDQIQLDTATAVPPHTPNPGFDLGTFALNPSQITSMCWDDTNNVWVVIQQKSGGFRLWRFNTDGSIKNNTFSGRPWVDDFNSRSNCTVTYDPVEADLAFLFLQSGIWFIVAPANVNKIPPSWILDDVNVGRFPTLGYDAVNSRYMLAQNDGGGGGEFHVRKFTITAGGGFPNATSTGTFVGDAGTGLSTRLHGVTYGLQVNGASNRYSFSGDAYSTWFVIDPATGAYKNVDGSYEQWGKPSTARAVCHDATQFASVDASGVLTVYTDWTWVDQPVTTWVGASAYDSDATGGTHETPVGVPLATIAQQRRAKLKITMPETNDSGGTDDPDKWKCYYYRGDLTFPDDSDLDYVGSTIGSPSAPTSVTLTADPAGGAPPGGIQGTAGATNNFPGANPGRIESAGADGDGALIQLVGDGSFRLGPYNVDSSGAQVDGDPTYDTGWVSGWAGKGGSTPFPNNANTTIDYAEYRRIGSVVHVRVRVLAGAAYNPASANHTNQVILTDLPAAVIPDQIVQMAGRFADLPVASIVQTNGQIVLVGAPMNNPGYAQSDPFVADATYMI